MTIKITNKKGNLYLEKYGEINLFKDYHIAYFNIDFGNKEALTKSWNIFPYKRFVHSPPKIDMGNERLKFTIENINLISEDDFINILNLYEVISRSIIKADEYEKEMEKVKEKYAEHCSDYERVKEKYDEYNNEIAKCISKLKSKYKIEESIELEFNSYGRLRTKQITIRGKR